MLYVMHLAIRIVNSQSDTRADKPPMPISPKYATKNLRKTPTLL